MPYSPTGSTVCHSTAPTQTNTQTYADNIWMQCMEILADDLVPQVFHTL